MSGDESSAYRRFSLPGKRNFRALFRMAIFSATGATGGRDHDIAVIDVLQFTPIFEEEMVVVGHIGIEVRAPRIDDDLTDQAGFGELVQGIVDGGQ